MKFYLCFLQSKHQYPIAGYSFWEFYLKNGITENGDTWSENHEVDWARGLLDLPLEEYARWKEKAWTMTLAHVRKVRPEVFLSYLYPQMVDENAIKEIQKMGIPCVNFFCDHLRMFRKLPNEFKIFDLFWVPEFLAKPLYIKEKVPFIHLPMPMWVDPKHRIASEEKNEQITFIGQKDLQRLLFFEKVISKTSDLPLCIYGNAWLDDDRSEVVKKSDYNFRKKLLYQISFIKQHGGLAYIRKLNSRGRKEIISEQLKTYIHPKVDFDNYIRLTKESMVTMGFNTFPSFKHPLSKPTGFSKLRDLEGPMLGSCYITEWISGLDELYDIENEILVFYTPEHFIEQINRLIKDRNLRKKLRVQGQKRALNDHTVGKSLEKIKQVLKA